MTTTPERRARVARRAAVLGVVLSLICHALPPEHREICQLLAKFCTGGLSS